jgi:hypothetical protein
MIRAHPAARVCESWISGELPGYSVLIAVNAGLDERFHEALS